MGCEEPYPDPPTETTFTKAINILMKRARSDTLTGGTKDVSPQYLSFAAAQSGADTVTTVSQAIPRQFLGQGARMVQVMEVLKVYFQFPTTGTLASATEITENVNCFLSTTSFGTTQTTLAEPRVFAGQRLQKNGAFTAAGSYGVSEELVKVWDATDGAGHGVIVATDNIYAQVGSSATGATNTVNIKVLYRWKNVPIEEFVGIVQSQQ